MKTPFLGPSYVSRSKTVANSRAVNLFPEVVETKQGKAIGAMYSTPGLNLYTNVGGGPIRGGLVANGNAYVVSGTQVYKIAPNLVATVLGTLQTQVGLVSMIKNSTQILISDGVFGYLIIIATNAFSTVASFPVGGANLVYQDGFGLTNVAGTNQFNQSNLNDFSTWNPLNFSTADGQPGNIITLADLNRELWVICENNTEVWINAGLAGFAFQRLSGVYIEIGCDAPDSAVHNVAQSVMWLSENENGDGIVYRTRGYTPERVSTHAQERIWRSYESMSDAFAFSYQQEGHTFYVITFPSGDATWVYDATESDKVGYPLWHERAYFNTLDGQFHRHLASCHFFFNDKNIVGDYRNGNLYVLDLSAYTDNGNPRKWLRTWRAWPPGQEKLVPMRFNSLQIDCQTGIDVPANSSPMMTLRFSNDGGQSWSTEQQASAGKTGETKARVIFRRLGSTRKNGGLDRVWELSSSDPTPAAIVGAEMDAELT